MLSHQLGFELLDFDLFNTLLRTFVTDKGSSCQAPGLFSSACAKFIFQFSDQRASC